ncbi:MAG: hypothetical protein ACRDMX_03485, partial [Solirubrobacteraceae bacterium]
MQVGVDLRPAQNAEDSVQGAELGRDAGRNRHDRALRGPDGRAAGLAAQLAHDHGGDGERDGDRQRERQRVQA